MKEMERPKRGPKSNVDMSEPAPLPHFSFDIQQDALESESQVKKPVIPKRSLPASDSAYSRLKKRKIVHSIMSSALLHPTRKTSNDASLLLQPHTTFQKRPTRMAPEDSCWTGDHSSWVSSRNLFTAFKQLCLSNPSRPIVKRSSMPYESTASEKEQVDRLLTRSSRSNSAPPLRLDLQQGGSDQYLLKSQVIQMLRMQLGAGQGESSLKLRKYVAWRAHYHHYVQPPLVHTPTEVTIPQASTSASVIASTDQTIVPSPERTDVFGEEWELEYMDDEDIDDLILDDFLEDHNYLSEFASTEADADDIILTPVQLDLPPRPVLRHAATHPLAKKGTGLYHRPQRNTHNAIPLVY